MANLRALLKRCRIQLPDYTSARARRYRRAPFIIMPVGDAYVNARPSNFPRTALYHNRAGTGAAVIYSPNAGGARVADKLDVSIEYCTS